MSFTLKKIENINNSINNNFLKIKGNHGYLLIKENFKLGLFDKKLNKPIIEPIYDKLRIINFQNHSDYHLPDNANKDYIFLYKDKKWFCYLDNNIYELDIQDIVWYKRSGCIWIKKNSK